MSIAYRNYVEKGGKFSPSRFVEVDCSKDSGLTVQASKDEVDINKIVARVNKGQAIPLFNDRPAQFDDFSEFGGLQDAIIKAQEAQELFLEYPADVRERFDNDVVKFVEFFNDARNYDEALKLGLVQKRPEAPLPPAPPAGGGQPV